MRDFHFPNTTQWDPISPTETEALQTLTPDTFLHHEKKLGLVRFAQLLILLCQSEQIEPRKLIDYFLILTAIHYAGRDAVSVSNSDHCETQTKAFKKRAWIPYQQDTAVDGGFLLSVRATPETLKSHDGFFQTDMHDAKTMEAEMIIQIESGRVFYNPYAFMSYDNTTKTFCFPSYSIMEKMIASYGVKARLPIVYFEKFSPEVMLTGLTTHQRTINFPPLYENMVSSYYGRVHSLRTEWFGVVSHDLYFHYPMESRSYYETQDFRVEVVNTVRRITGEDQLLTKALWRDFIDFEQDSKSSLVTTLDFFVTQFNNLYFTQVNPFFKERKSTFELAVAFLLFYKSNKADLIAAYEASYFQNLSNEKPFSAFKTVIEKIFQLQFVDLSDDQSLAIKAAALSLYLYHEEARGSNADFNKLCTENQIQFLNAIVQLDTQYAYEVKEGYASFSFSKNPKTKNLDVEIDAVFAPTPVSIKTQPTAGLFKRYMPEKRTTITRPIYSDDEVYHRNPG